MSENERQGEVSDTYWICPTCHCGFHTMPDVICPACKTEVPLESVPGKTEPVEAPAEEGSPPVEDPPSEEPAEEHHRKPKHKSRR